MSPKPRASRKKRTAQAILALPAAAFLFLAIHGATVDLIRIRDQRRRVAARTASTEGTIIQMYEAARGTVPFPKAVVAFTSPTGEAVHFTTPAWKSDKVGQKLPIYYDPLNPGNYSANNEAPGHGEAFSGNAFPLGLGAFFVFLILWIGRTPDEEL